MNQRIANSLGASALVLVVISLWMVFIYVPTEADSGIVQRIFYFHVPCAWITFAAFALAAVSGGFYLWLGQQLWDDLGYAAAEIGMIFCTLVLATGSIWAKPIWGTWWTWDSRLTSTFILWLLYGGYLVLRNLADDSPQVARFAAVFAVAAVIDVPVIVISVRLWRTIHPAVLLTRSGEHGLQDPRMIATLLVSGLAFAVMFVWLLMLRLAVLRANSRLFAMRRDLALLRLSASRIAV
jgi:heme exporter protein C